MKKGDMACIQHSAVSSTQDEIKYVHPNGEVILKSGVCGFPVGHPMAPVFASEEKTVDYVFEHICDTGSNQD